MPVFPDCNRQDACFFFRIETGKMAVFFGLKQAFRPVPQISIKIAGTDY
jgi:hypothetical protein